MSKSAIEWTDETALPVLHHGKFDYSSQAWVRILRHRHPLIKRHVSFGRIAERTCRDDVPRFRLTTFGDWIHVVPRFKWVLAISAKTIETFKKAISSEFRNWLYAPLATGGMLYPTKPEVRIIGISASFVFQCVRFAQSKPGNLGTRKPLGAHSAPGKAGRLHSSAFSGSWFSRCWLVIAALAYGLVAVATRFINIERVNGQPLHAFSTMLQSCGNVCNVLVDRNAESRRRNLHNPQFAAHNGASING